MFDKNVNIKSLSYIIKLKMQKFKNGAGPPWLKIASSFACLSALTRDPWTLSCGPMFSSPLGSQFSFDEVSSVDIHFLKF